MLELHKIGKECGYYDHKKVETFDKHPGELGHIEEVVYCEHHFTHNLKK